MEVKLSSSELMERFVVILLGVILAPIIYQQAAQVNITGTPGMIIALIPIFFSLLVLFASVKGLI